MSTDIIITYCGETVTMSWDGSQASAPILMVRDTINGGWTAFGDSVDMWLSEPLASMPSDVVRTIEGEAAEEAAIAR